MWKPLEGTWATRALATTVAKHNQPSRITTVGDRFGVEVEMPDPPRKPKPIRPFTDKQFDRWLESQRGWADEFEEGAEEDSASDMAEGIIRFPDPEAQRAVAHLKNRHPEMRGWTLRECLAELLHSVARSKKEGAHE